METVTKKNEESLLIPSKTDEDDDSTILQYTSKITKKARTIPRMKRAGEIRRAEERGQAKREGRERERTRKEEMKYRLCLDVISAVQSNDKHLHCWSSLHLTF